MWHVHTHTLPGAICLSETRFGTEGAFAVSSLLEKHQGIFFLNLNGMCEFVCHFMISFFRQHHWWPRFGWNCTCIKAQYIPSIYFFRRFVSSFLYMFLMCYIAAGVSTGIEGSTHLIKLIQTNSSIKTISYKENQISDTGLCRIAAALCKNNHISTFKITGIVL